MAIRTRATHLQNGRPTFMTRNQHDVTCMHASSSGAKHRKADKSSRHAKKSTKSKLANANPQKPRLAFKYEKIARDQFGAISHLPGYENPITEELTKRFFQSKNAYRSSKLEAKVMAPTNAKPKPTAPKPIINGIFMEKRKRVDGPARTYMLFNGDDRTGLRGRRSRSQIRSHSRKRESSAVRVKSASKSVRKSEFEEIVPPPREPIERIKQGSFKERIEAIIKNKKELEQIKKEKRARAKKRLMAQNKAKVAPPPDTKAVEKIPEATGLYNSQSRSQSRSAERTKPEKVRSLKSRIESINRWRKENNITS